MDRMARLVRRIRIASAIGALTVGIGAGSAQGQALLVSLPNLNLQNRERIVGFEFHIQSGRIAQLADLPIGWNISVNNDPSWNTTVEGSVMVGAAALGPEFFRSFLVVDENRSLGLPFAIHGEIVVTRDFAKERRIEVGPRDFVTKALPNLRGRVR